MRVRTAAALLGTAGSLALLLSFKTPDSTAPAGSVVTAGAPPAGRSVRPGGTAAAPATVPDAVGTPSANPSPSSPQAQADGLVKGPVVPTRYGNVQVEVDTSAGRITNIVALQLPSDRRRSAEISSYAEPILHDEVIQAQSARIDTVSGATYTSDAYAQSLQAVLDGHA